MYHYYLGSILNDLGTLTVDGCDITLTTVDSKLSNNMYDGVYTETNLKSLDFNFWGCDENPFESGFTNFQQINYWFYLDILPEYLALDINESGNITVNFKLNNPQIGFDLNKLPKVNITFSSVVNNQTFFELSFYGTNNI